MSQNFPSEYSNLAQERLLSALHEHLISKSLTVATAESCTGGMLASVLTQRSGSSAFFLGGASAYANEAKTILLSVPKKLIVNHGAVSREVAIAMAEGIRHKLNPHLAISITGIAGPLGGSKEKPVGTVWIGIASPKGLSANCLALSGSRDEIRVKTVYQALLALWLESN